MTVLPVAGISREGQSGFKPTHPAEMSIFQPNGFYNMLIKANPCVMQDSHAVALQQLTAGFAWYLLPHHTRIPTVQTIFRRSNLKHHHPCYKQTSRISSKLLVCTKPKKRDTGELRAAQYRNKRPPLASESSLITTSGSRRGLFLNFHGAAALAVVYFS